MKIEMNKRYTSSGEPIRILCTDRPEGYPIVGMVEKNGVIQYFKENGESAVFSRMDLVEVWEPTEGDWCWFWNSTGVTVLDTFIKMGANKFQSDGGMNWKYCAKFTGELPNHLRGE